MPSLRKVDRPLLTLRDAATTAQVRDRFGDEAVDACLSGSVVPAPPKPILPGDPNKGSYRKSKAQHFEAQEMLFAWLQEVEHDRVAQDELFSEYTNAQLADTLAGLLQDTAKALRGRVLTGLERERLAELLVQVARVNVKKVDKIDVEALLGGDEALLGGDWASLVAKYTEHLEDAQRRNDEYAERWAKNDEAEEAFDELVATGWGSGPRSNAKDYWWKVAGRSAARFFPKDMVGGDEFSERHQ